MSDDRSSPRPAGGAVVAEATSASDTLAPADLVTASRTRRPAPFDEQALLQAGRIVEHLRSQLAELDRREQSLNAQISALEQEQRLFRLKVREWDEQCQERQHALREGDARVADRERLLDERLAVLEEQEQEFSRQRKVLDAERAELKNSIDAEIAEDRRQIFAGQKLLAADRTAHAQAVETWTRERDQQLREIESRRETVHAELDEREQQVSRGEVDLAKRTRFHEDHLQRFRTELESQRVELERDRQRQRVWKEQVEQSLRLRLAHVRRFRDLVEQREESLVRGERALEAARSTTEQELQVQREQLVREREAFERNQARDRSDARRQQELMHSHSRALDERRQKLDALREEIEHSQREVLEQQMVLEQARAALVGEAGQEEAGHRIEMARKALLEFHRQLAAASEERRLELEAVQLQVQERRLSFRDEREALAARLADREREADERERRLNLQVVGLHERELKWRQLREQWRQERGRAEEIIRGLVDQLESLLEDQEPPTPAADGPESISVPSSADAA